MREIARTSTFKRDLKRLARSKRYEAGELLDVVRTLAELFG